MEWLRFIFNSQDFVTKGELGQWDEFHHYLYLSSTAGIGFLKFVMPILWVLVLIPFLRIKPHKLGSVAVLRIPLFRVVLANSAFVVVSGAGRLLDEFGSWYWPAYRVFAWWHFLTFIVGIVSTLYLLKIASQEIQHLNQLPESTFNPPPPLSPLPLPSPPNPRSNLIQQPSLPPLLNPLNPLPPPSQDK